jgi:hypothetical protein
MDADSFNDLALRVIAGEANDAERQALETELLGHPGRRDEYEQIKVTHDILRATAPMTEAARATSPELPAYRVNELRTAVRQHFGPAAQREKKSGSLRTTLRWIFAGGGATALVVLLVVLNLSNRTVEVGVYRSYQMRSDETALSSQDVPTATVISFDQDAPFDQWQSAPLGWSERAKIWVDNEHDLLHIVHRVNHGQISRETYPLAPTNDGQREQIKQMVDSLKN